MLCINFTFSLNSPETFQMKVEKVKDFYLRLLSRDENGMKMTKQSWKSVQIKNVKSDSKIIAPSFSPEMISDILIKIGDWFKWHSINNPD